jgi:hypothetical protein
MLKKLLYLLVIGFLSFIYLDLGKENVNVDQFLWYERTDNFFNAFLAGDFASTYQQYHPGVLLMYLIRLGQFTYQSVTGDFSDFSSISYLDFPLYNFWTKFYLVTFALTLLLISVLLLNKITKNKTIPLLFLIILLSEPYFIGNIRNLHMDALISALFVCSLLSFVVGLQQRNFKYVIFSGLIAGLGLLTKSILLTLIMLNLMVALYFYLINIKDRRWIFRMSGLFLATTVVTFVILFPAMWVAPIQTVGKIINDGVISTGISGNDSFTHFMEGTATKDPGPTFYSLVLKYRFSLLTQFLMVLLPFCIIHVFYKNGIKGTINLAAKPGHSYGIFVVALIIYIVCFLITLTFMDKKTDRYLTTLFPLMSILGAYTVFYIGKVLTGKRKRFIFGAAAILLIISNIITLFLIHPYYFAYYNPVWGGLSTARNEMYINQGGIGAYEVAQYINASDVDPGDRLGATNYKEIQVFLKYKIGGFDNQKMGKYKFVVLTMQRDRQFKKGTETVKAINILGNDYLIISRGDD